MNTDVTAGESLTPSLLLNGEAKAALTLYRDVLGGELTITYFADSPAQGDVPADWRGNVLFGQLQTPEGIVISAMDAPPSRAVQIGGNVALYYQCSSQERAANVFSALAAGGTVRMPLGKTFFSEAFGMLADRFGTVWMISYRGA